MATRVPRGMKTSVLRVMTTRYPLACSTLRRRRATSSVIMLSETRCPGIPPRSKPPWPASMTTTVLERTGASRSVEMGAALVRRGGSGRFSREERALAGGRA